MKLIFSSTSFALTNSLICFSAVKQQSKDTYNYVEELKTGWTATDFAVADLMRDLNGIIDGD